ncbi:phosphoglucomutase/phosphomannomutase PgmG [Sphingomonas sp.]|uniref:phosphoglucomutase/phosphomannomutase PgmG n=1 Tax=Sphingomonas sp. TaxID=28214 RepID=UPI003CC5AF68
MSHRFDATVLRDYDVRGVVGATLGPADADALGRSFATRVRRAGGARVAVGFDGRISSPVLETALIEGLIASGVDVVRIGLGPTPQLYFAEATLAVDAGVQVTGSHNPAAYNGFKMVLGHRAFYGGDIQDLARLAAAGDWEAGAGTVTTADVRENYVQRLARGFAGNGYRIGWDPANGAAGPVIERLVQLLPGEHHVINADVDGTFPNHHPDPTVEANLDQLKRLVAERRLDFGLGFDGDGDRLGAIDGEGRMVWGDQLMMLLAEPVLRRHPGSPIIADVKSSDALFDRIRDLGGRPVMTRSGHSVLKAALSEHGAPLAGELSGHIFFADDWHGFDDAQYAAVRLIEAVSASGRTLTELRGAMPALCTTPELRIPVDEARKWAVVDEVLARLHADAAEVNAIDGARVTTADGWWLLRASNTEAALTARAEARDEAGLARLVAAIGDQLARSGIADPFGAGGGAG